MKLSINIDAQALAKAAYNNSDYVDAERSASEFIQEWSNALVFALPKAKVEISQKWTHTGELYSIDVLDQDSLDAETMNMTVQLATDLAEIVFLHRNWIVPSRYIEAGSHRK